MMVLSITSGVNPLSPGLSCGNSTEETFEGSGPVGFATRSAIPAGASGAGPGAAPAGGGAPPPTSAAPAGPGPAVVARGDFGFDLRLAMDVLHSKRMLRGREWRDRMMADRVC
ncbi:MAG: hypothetical protein ACM35G_04615 [Planctomycetaceae bacterium]